MACSLKVSKMAQQPGYNVKPSPHCTVLLEIALLEHIEIVPNVIVDKDLTTPYINIQIQVPDRQKCSR